MTIHFEHCYAYDGSYCSCGAQANGGYTGDQPGPDLPLPAAPFNLAGLLASHYDDEGER